ncbi:MAG: CoA pyrophosphatase [Acidobacteriota bacterium]|nr:CoA pyrophosphatase [Acidobacteriota bacterium]
MTDSSKPDSPLVPEVQEAAADLPSSWIVQLRGRLTSPPPSRLAATGDRSAAVLVPLFVDAGELWVLLTRRAEALPKHRSQIAFPGGTLEPGETPWEGALREAQEEVGLIPETVLQLGELDELQSTTGFRVLPCVGCIPSGFQLRINPDEIADTFRVPLTALANPRLIEDRPVVVDGHERMLRVYHVGSRQIWGITAKMLQNLLRRLGMEPSAN